MDEEIEIPLDKLEAAGNDHAETHLSDGASGSGANSQRASSSRD